MDLASGCTGAFAYAVLRKFLKTVFKKIGGFTRDGNKQEKARMSSNNPADKWYVSDVEIVDIVADVMAVVE